MVLIWIDAELNALPDENRMSFQYSRNLLHFDQILNEYDYTKSILSTLNISTSKRRSILKVLLGFSVKKLISLF